MSRIRADKLVNRLGTGGPTFPNGVAAGFSVSGIVTATSFRGDGSSLTGIDASALKDGSDVKVQATATGATVTGTLFADVTGNLTGTATTANSLSAGATGTDLTLSGDLTVNGTTSTIDTVITAVDSLNVEGNVGIGTDNPQNKLDVRGDIRIQDSIPTILFRSPDGSSNQYYIGANISDSVDGGFIIGEGSDINGGTERIRINHLGNIGINSTTPSGRLDVGGNILPDADNTRDLGSASKRWANIYTGDLNLSNEGAVNDVDGTWGQYTIQEGENDLFLINRRTGKKYKFNLTEVN